MKCSYRVSRPPRPTQQVKKQEVKKLIPKINSAALETSQSNIVRSSKTGRWRPAFTCLMALYSFSLSSPVVVPHGQIYVYNYGRPLPEV